MSVDSGGQRVGSRRCFDLLLHQLLDLTTRLATVLNRDGIMINRHPRSNGEGEAPSKLGDLLASWSTVSELSAVRTATALPTAFWGADGKDTTDAASFMGGNLHAVLANRSNEMLDQGFWVDHRLLDRIDLLLQQR